MKKIAWGSICFVILALATYFGAYSAYWAIYKNKSNCYFSKGINHGANLLFNQAVSDSPFFKMVLLDPTVAANYYLRILIADSKGEQFPSLECRWVETVEDAKSRYPNAYDMIRHRNEV